MSGEAPRSGKDSIGKVESRMNEEALEARSAAFQHATAGTRGMTTYGTGKPGVGAEHMRKVRKREEAAAKRKAAREEAEHE